jgi:tetratricopeptide (TPR) repeat protein
MPEPVTISTLAIAGLGWVAGSAAGVAGPVAGGIVKGASAQVFPAVVRATKDRIAGLRNPPESQDVARAVRVAQIQALERVIRDFQVARPERFGALFARPGDFFERSRAFCADAIGRSTNPSVKLNLEVTPALASAIDGLLAPPAPGGPADQHARAVAALAEDAVLEELSEVLSGVRLPDGFEEHFRNGSRSKPRFLDLFAVYITGQIKGNQDFRAVLNSVQVASIEALAFDARELATRIEERFGAALDRLEPKIDKIGVGVDRLDERVKLLITRMEEGQGISRAALQAILRRLGEAEVPDDQILERLGGHAEELLELKEQLAQVARIYPDLAGVQQEAQTRINAGDLSGARDLLSEARQTVRASRQDRSKEEAALLAREADIDRLESRYVEAVEKYDEAAGLVSFDQETQFGYLLQEAITLQNQGAVFADHNAMQRAIQVYAKTATLRSQASAPFDWAMIQNNLGAALSQLARQRRDADLMMKAVDAYRAALEVRTRERDPLGWAMTQNNLNHALNFLGERESEADRLTAVVEVYQGALDWYPRERLPLGWASIQNELGTARRRLGEREVSTEQLKQAVDAYRAALEERTRERVPSAWAETQNNLGMALLTLGRRENCKERLEEAVDAYRAALEEYTRERVSLHWASIQNQLGSALQSLGEREGSTQNLEQAATAYRAALEEFTRERAPLDWADTQNQLGDVLLSLGMKESSAEWLEEAVDAYRAALEERTREQVPYDWAMTQNYLGDALLELGEGESNTERLEEATDAYRAALKEYTRDLVPLAWATIQHNLGLSLASIGERDSGTERLEEAIEAYRAALEVFETGGTEYSSEAAIAEANLASAKELLAKRIHQQRED